VTDGEAEKWKKRGDTPGVTVFETGEEDAEGWRDLLRAGFQLRGDNADGCGIFARLGMDGLRRGLLERFGGTGRGLGI